ncbi:hypothetical protein [Streptomyces boncukensis]|uniref:Fido domain-containing protein n=1 Tax=Streptomyces boncukensis TaxID=2711219 RepID=A0A6G4WYW9_9ACTN|nr:hypothetical protein [Streptomyces boncukensis]NGO69714.1 hypothetical protein [Streptomyces boncukensis]
MTLYLDAGWILNVQIEVSPPNTPVRDWGSLHCMTERHKYERIAGEPYYEEVPTRAATFLHTALLLEPFSDYNAAIGAACAQMYMAMSGEPVMPPPGGMAKLVQEAREQRAGLGDVARRLRDWKA